MVPSAPQHLAGFVRARGSTRVALKIALCRSSRLSEFEALEKFVDWRA